MATSVNTLKSLYENFEVKELEKMFFELKKCYCFNSKEEQINYILKNYLDSSIDINNKNTKIALEYLLKEKTGKTYKIKPKTFNIKLNDVINYVTHSINESSILNNFLKKININKHRKKQFLFEIYQNKKYFNDFLKEIHTNSNEKEIFNKYQELSHNFVLENTMFY